MPWTQNYAALGNNIGLTALAVSIPILLLTPLIMARNIRRSNLGSCMLDSKK